MKVCLWVGWREPVGGVGDIEILETEEPGTVHTGRDRGEAGPKSTSVRPALAGGWNSTATKEVAYCYLDDHRLPGKLIGSMWKFLWSKCYHHAPLKDTTAVPTHRAGQRWARSL